MAQPFPIRRLDLGGSGSGGSTPPSYMVIGYLRQTNAWTTLT